MPDRDGSRFLACVEVGGGSVQTVVFRGDGYRILPGARQPPGARLALAVPGLIGEGVVVEASNLGWRNTDPVAALGLTGPASLVLNDGEAAAIGEVALRDDATERLVFIGLGTGIAGAVVRNGRIAQANLFAHNVPGHGMSFGNLECRCGRRGCLETVAAGWALPDPLDETGLFEVADAVARAVRAEPLAEGGLVVVGGGIPKRFPVLVDLIALKLKDPTVESSRAPVSAKSAAAWGLRFALDGSRTLGTTHTLATSEEGR